MDRVLTLACHAANPMDVQAEVELGKFSTRTAPAFAYCREDSRDGPLLSSIVNVHWLRALKEALPVVPCWQPRSWHGRPLGGGKLLCRERYLPALCCRWCSGYSTIHARHTVLRKGSNLRADLRSGNGNACNFEWEQLLRVSLGLLRPDVREHSGWRLKDLHIKHILAGGCSYRK